MRACVGCSIAAGVVVFIMGVYNAVYEDSEPTGDRTLLSGSGYDNTADDDRVRFREQANRSVGDYLHPEIQEALSQDRESSRSMMLRNIVLSGRYKNVSTPDLYELLDGLVLTYSGDSEEYRSVRDVRVELARRDEDEPLKSIVHEAVEGDFDKSRWAVTDLGRVGTADAIVALVAMLDDPRSGESSGGVWVDSPRFLAARELRKCFPDSPLGAGRIRADSIERFKQWWWKRGH